MKARSNWIACANVLLCSFSRFHSFSSSLFPWMSSKSNDISVAANNIGKHSRKVTPRIFQLKCSRDLTINRWDFPKSFCFFDSVFVYLLSTREAEEVKMVATITELKPCSSCIYNTHKKGRNFLATSLIGSSPGHPWFPSILPHRKFYPTECGKFLWGHICCQNYSL